MVGASRLAAGAMAVAMLLPAAYAPAAFAAAADCEFDVVNVPAAPRFADYPAAPRRPARPVPLQLAARMAQMFRTVLRDAAAAGPNFAGGDTIAVWGCGASCTSAAIIDGRSGHVSFPDAIADIDTTRVLGREPDGTEPTFYSLRFRPDSRLLIVLGAPGENAARNGVAFYVWTGTTLKPLRFVLRAALCGSP